MKTLSEFKKSLVISLWFMLLTFPIMVIRVNTIEKVVEWRWRNMAIIGIGAFLLSFMWRRLLGLKERGRKRAERDNAGIRSSGRDLFPKPHVYRYRSPWPPLHCPIAFFPFSFPGLPDDVIVDRPESM